MKKYRRHIAISFISAVGLSLVAAIISHGLQTNAETGIPVDTVITANPLTEESEDISGVDPTTPEYKKSDIVATPAVEPATTAAIPAQLAASPSPLVATFTRENCPSGSGSLMLLKPMNKSVQLHDYIPINLVSIRDYIPTKDRRPICLEKDSALALLEMVTAAKSAGIQIVITSGFRDYHWQESLYNNHVNKYGTVPERIAPAGTSEHQLGTTVDVTSPEIDNDSASLAFANTDAYDWMMAHAWEYGFSKSYTEHDENVTGYLYEPWHFRYVGKDVAAVVRSSEKPLFEVLSQL